MMMTGPTFLKSVDSYLAFTFLTFLLGVLGVLTGALQLLDLVGRSDEILAGADGDWTAIGRYVRLRAPAITAQFAAPAALIAAMAAFASLNRSSELIVFRAVGVSPGRMMRPLVQTGAILALVHFMAHDGVVAPDRAKLAAWEANGFGADVAADDGAGDPIWVALRDAYIKVDAVEQTEETFRIVNVTIYERDAFGQLSARLQARTAQYDEGVWTLREVDRFEGETRSNAQEGELVWSTGATPAQFLNAILESDAMTSGELVRTISQLERQGVEAADLRTDLFHRVSASVALALMPCLGAVVAFGAPRRNPLLLRAAAGMGLGFVYFVTENMMVALGRIGATAPALAAFTPLIAFSIIGAAVLLYGDENFGRPGRGRRRLLQAAADD